ncbi:MAG TPA: hypothetical protein VEY92_03375, partial [Pseudoxanthomonas sp.]|nr:hypothetical protein [Pseudoxanthomonas sp.]
MSAQAGDAATVPSATIRTLVVDDEPLARRGLELRLAAHPDIEIVGQCGDGAAAIAAVHRLR